MGKEINVLDSINKNNININSKFVLSVSGGVDSMVLLDCFLKSGLDFCVVNFNHQKRDSSILDYELVKNVCEKNNIKFYYFVLEFGDENFHNEAHNKRIEHLKYVSLCENTKYCITAHHADDLFETVLLKIIRGSNLLGYSGFNEYYEKDGYVFLKPFITYSKADILIYAKNNNIKYNEDETNSKDYYLRNKIRHTIVPLIKQENVSILNQVSNYSTQLINAFNHIRNTTINFLNNSLEINITEFIKLDIAIKEDCISYLLEKYSIVINKRKIDLVRYVLESNKPNIKINIGNNMVFVKEYDKAYFRYESIQNDVKFELINVNNVCYLPMKNMLENVNIYKLCYNEIVFPLYLRKRMDGDELVYHYGHKKLKKVFIDKKVPTSKRDEYLIIVDSNNTIILIPGLYTNRYLGSGNILEIRFGEGDE
jgi:tRNA(Ile)-lysidine synthetase-like protein